VEGITSFLQEVERFPTRVRIDQRKNELLVVFHIKKRPFCQAKCQDGKAL
jgi:hypothetical protein